VWFGAARECGVPFLHADYGFGRCPDAAHRFSSFDALTRSGFKGWRTRKQFNQMASELAFHRCRVARGLHSTQVDVREVEEAYVHILNQLLDNVRIR